MLTRNLVQHVEYFSFSSLAVFAANTQELDSAAKERLKQEAAAVAASGCRTLCLAQRTIDDTDASVAPMADDFADLETDLIAVAIFGLEDPVRQQVPNSIRDCNRAGINVLMVTGDNKLTASNIASQCGILNDARGDESVVEGPDFRKRVLTEEVCLFSHLRAL